jgi:hypothetical protein
VLVDAMHPLARYDGAQWDAAIGESPDVPDVIALRMRWRFYGYAGALRISGLCRSYRKHWLQTVLTDALVDTSELASGPFPKPRITHHDELRLVDVPLVFIPSTVVRPGPSLVVNNGRGH